MVPSIHYSGYAKWVSMDKSKGHIHALCMGRIVYPEFNMQQHASLRWLTFVVCLTPDVTRPVSGLALRALD